MAQKNGRDVFNEAVKLSGIKPDLVPLAQSIYSQESGEGRNTKTSNAGAVGGMQILPSTFNQFASKGYRDINNPIDNVIAGLNYISYLDGLSKNSGDSKLRDIAAGYYGGPKAMGDKVYSDLKNPNAPNTKQYADQVLARMGKANRGAIQPLETISVAGKGVVPDDSNKPVIEASKVVYEPIQIPSNDVIAMAQYTQPNTVVDSVKPVEVSNDNKIVSNNGLNSIDWLSQVSDGGFKPMNIDQFDKWMSELLA